ncbi:MAG: lipopolysaccharide biosynthesis protein RfbH [Lachnospiraceae bacterium]|nr:lipopolysaccharide biosynthesis protein RfbH [Lachnospiraceae bacterium]
MSENEARKEILSLVKEYYNNYMDRSGDKFVEGDRIAYASRVFDENEVCALVDSALDFWLTAGKYAKEFEKGMSELLDVKHTLLVNSGSSANLLAFMTLTAPELGERCIRRGDEVITVAAGFPTTITPMLQYGAVPVFLDVTIPEANIDTELLEKAYSDKTKAVMIAHTLGNPFNIKAVKEFCDRHNLWLVEDNCDALCSKYAIDGVEQYTGTWGDIGTSSFYPPHHMTMGEGGAVYTDNPLLYKIAKSMRDWGRDCACDSGQDNMCGHRYDGRYGELPAGYDHKYVYSHFGYNLKATDMQAAIGCEQLKKVVEFGRKRKANWEYLREQLEELEEWFILPEAEKNSTPSWFGFLIFCREGVDRNAIVRHLEQNNIQTRMLFSGNMIKHPCFDEMRKTGAGYRVVGELTNTDYIMNNAFWIGVYPGMTKEKLDVMARELKAACKKAR